MPFLKFSLPFLIFSAATASFNTLECINASFEALISHRAFPFGWTKTKLGIRKNGCVLQIRHRKLEFIKKVWSIDVCREPVHIKLGANSVEVLRRDGGCPRDTKFCEQLDAIEDIIQNDGLIFAEGEKENLSNNHGKVYCTFLLIEKYLKDGAVFNRSSTDIDIFSRKRHSDEAPKPREGCPKPATETERTTINADEKIDIKPIPEEPKRADEPPSQNP